MGRGTAGPTWPRERDPVRVAARVRAWRRGPGRSRAREAGRPRPRRPGPARLRAPRPPARGARPARRRAPGHRLGERDRLGVGLQGDRLGERDRLSLGGRGRLGFGLHSHGFGERDRFGFGFGFEDWQRLKLRLRGGLGDRGWLRLELELRLALGFGFGIGFGKSLGLRKGLVRGERGHFRERAYLGEGSNLGEGSDLGERASLGEEGDLGERARAGFRPGRRGEGRLAGLAEVAGIRLGVVRDFERPGILPALGRRNRPRRSPLHDIGPRLVGGSGRPLVWLRPALPGAQGPDPLSPGPVRGSLRRGARPDPGLRSGDLLGGPRRDGRYRCRRCRYGRCHRGRYRYGRGGGCFQRASGRPGPARGLPCPLGPRAGRMPVPHPDGHVDVVLLRKRGHPAPGSRLGEIAELRADQFRQSLALNDRPGAVSQVSTPGGST